MAATARRPDRWDKDMVVRVAGRGREGGGPPRHVKGSLSSVWCRTGPGPVRHAVQATYSGPANCPDTNHFFHSQVWDLGRAQQGQLSSAQSATGWGGPQAVAAVGSLPFGQLMRVWLEPPLGVSAGDSSVWPLREADSLPHHGWVPRTRVPRDGKQKLLVSFFLLFFFLRFYF